MGDLSYEINKYMDASVFASLSKNHQLTGQFLTNIRQVHQ